MAQRHAAESTKLKVPGVQTQNREMLASRAVARTAARAARVQQQTTRGMAVTMLEDFETYKSWKSDATNPAKVVYFTATRSEERREGKECVRTYRPSWSPDP